MCKHSKNINVIYIPTKLSIRNLIHNNESIKTMLRYIHQLMVEHKFWRCLGKLHTIAYTFREMKGHRIDI